MLAECVALRNCGGARHPRRLARHVALRERMMDSQRTLRHRLLGSMSRQDPLTERRGYEFVKKSSDDPELTHCEKVTCGVRRSLADECLARISGPCPAGDARVRRHPEEPVDDEFALAPRKMTQARASGYSSAETRGHGLFPLMTTLVSTGGVFRTHMAPSCLPGPDTRFHEMTTLPKVKLASSYMPPPQASPWS